MGGAVSTGNDNDDLIDNLLGADYIRTPTIERVFRAVDRAEYFLPETRSSAYKDLAWKRGNLHLSAPCIYSEVMEGLCLRPGLSFLNLGSGTGYLSTMVGLVLGSSGINHGIELHTDVVQYANKKLEIFKRYSGAVDEFDFCEPKFIQGNCLCLSSDTRLYDRIYCGAACPDPYENYIKHMLKVGGILVMPLNDQLLQIKRTSKNTWDVRSLLLVSFATLVQPCADNREFLRMVDLNPRSLQEMCRSLVRNMLRNNITKEYPELKKIHPPPKKAPKKKRALRRLVVPLFDTSEDSSDDEFLVRSRHIPRRERNEEEEVDDNAPTAQVREMMLNYVLDRIRDRRNHVIAQRQMNYNAQAQNARGNDNNDRTTEDAENNAAAGSNEQADNGNQGGGSGVATTSKVTAVIEYNPGSQEGENNGAKDAEATAEHPTNDNDIQTNSEAGTSNNGGFAKVPPYMNITMDDILNDTDDEETIHPEESAQLEETASTSKTGKRNNREKFDSGLGEDIIEAPSNLSSERSDSENHMEVESNEESADEIDEEERGSKRGSNNDAPGTKWRRVTLSPNRCMSGSSTENDTTQDDSKSGHDEIRVIPSLYTAHMKTKIQELPLPSLLKNYLNFYREF